MKKTTKALQILDRREVERYPNRWLHRRKAPPVGDKNYDEIKIERKI
jgi:hypothetical protein